MPCNFFLRGDWGGFGHPGHPLATPLAILSTSGDMRRRRRLTVSLNEEKHGGTVHVGLKRSQFTRIALLFSTYNTQKSKRAQFGDMVPWSFDVWTRTGAPVRCESASDKNFIAQSCVFRRPKQSRVQHVHTQLRLASYSSRPIEHFQIGVVSR